MGYMYITKATKKAIDEKNVSNQRYHLRKCNIVELNASSMVSINTDSKLALIIANAIPLCHICQNPGYQPDINLSAEYDAYMSEQENVKQEFHGDATSIL